ncbi:hypothetical protein R0K04_12730 [Pseudoalteromonas sp. SIMBA_153]|jgi:hypothetical protein|uniref:hypothetical protein n=1 Tax=Pseudoalteromonas sp. SK20 TaxID=1938367 RepID=UPI000975F36D|nr:hypothetical protein [Pseudoalteromonas sp. SK20]
MAVLEISSDADAFAILKEALEGKFDGEDLQLNFNNWPCLHLNVKGARYHSTITYSMMHSLIEYQKVIYRTYVDIFNKGSVQSLSHNERKALEVVFKVEEGSSNLLGDAAGALAEFAKGAVGKMDSKQIILLVLGAGVLFGGYHIADTYMNNQVKMVENEAKNKQAELEEKNRHEITLELLKNNRVLMDAANGSEAAVTKFLVSVKDADKASVGDSVTLKQKDLEELAKPERKPTALKRVDGNYKINSFKRKVDDFHLTIYNVDTKKEFTAWIRAGVISIDETRKILNSCVDKQSIFLNILARANDTTTKAADIIGVENKANAVNLEK